MSDGKRRLSLLGHILEIDSFLYSRKYGVWKALEIFVRKSEWKRIPGDLGITERILCLADTVWASLTLICWSSGSSRGLLETLKRTLGYLPDNTRSFW